MTRQSVPVPAERRRAEAVVEWVRSSEPADVVAVLDAAMRESIARPSWWASSALALAEGIDPDLDRYAPPVGRWALAGDVLDDVLLGLIVHMEAQGEAWADRVALRCRRWLGWRRRDVDRCTEAGQVLGVVPLWGADEVFARLVALMVRHPSGRALANGEQSHPRYLRHLLAGPRRPWLWPWEPVGTLGHPAPDDEVVIVVPSDFGPSELDLHSVAHLAVPGVPFVHRVRAEVLEPWRRGGRGATGSKPKPRDPVPEVVDEVDESALIVTKVEPEPVPVDVGPKPDGIVDGVPIRLDDLDSWGDSRPSDWGW